MYGRNIPALTGTLSGVPTADAANVWAVFSTTAVVMSPAGSYPITATLAGPSSANYTVVLGPSSGRLQITTAASVTTEQPLTQGSYAGLPLIMSATVNPSTQGMPTGTVTFTDNGSKVTSATLMNGVASATYLSPSVGAHSIVASYEGDANFTASVSQAQTATVSTMPDFTVATSGNSTQTVASGEAAAYNITVVPQSGAFTGVVNFSASGLPAGATATFSPPQVVPGTTTTTVTMSVQTSNLVTVSFSSSWRTGVLLAFTICPWLLWRSRRRLSWKDGAICVALVIMTGLSGCGSRTIAVGALGGQSYALTVTGTSTNLAGAVVSHSTQITLVVD
jgi:hypothetical protein